MKGLAALFLALIAALPTPASAQSIRAVFVGVDTYLYSTTPKRKAVFKDLKGAVGDTFRIKEALKNLYDVQVDSLTQQNMTETSCQAELPTSITLVNTCAKRDAILAALNKMIDTTPAGDTLIFYFAGHGSQYADDEDFNQASGYNGTILPTDARQPGSVAKGDILDKELKVIKDRAVARGIRFVSIFDSCNSGTGTRAGSAGETRNVPPLEARPPTRPAPPPPSGPGGGYWVHFAAAQDGEQAQEVGTSGAVGVRAGVFTSALIDTMHYKKYATFGDMIRMVRNKVELRGFTTQNPMAEGQLTASLGSTARKEIPLDVKVSGTDLQLKIGKLSGMTEGSIITLFATEEDAFKVPATPLATARITSVSPYASSMVLETQPASALPENLVGIETQHAFGDLQLYVANKMMAAADTKIVQTVLDGMVFVGKGGEAQVRVSDDPDQRGHAVLRANSGTVIGALGAIKDAGFADKLQGKLKKVLRVQQLLALSEVTEPTKADIAFCIGNGDYPPADKKCGNAAISSDTSQPENMRDVRVLKRNEPAIVTVHNQSDTARFMYVLGIDPTYGVALISPPPGTSDFALKRGRPGRAPGDTVVPTATGTYRFITLASDEQINAAVFEQEGTNTRDGSACKGALARLLCDANKGKRDATAPRVGSWTAIVETVTVK